MKGNIHAKQYFQNAKLNPSMKMTGHSLKLAQDHFHILSNSLFTLYHLPNVKVFEFLIPLSNKHQIN